ncbi:MAG: WbqC family protein [Rikenellaceae bacterium]
MQVFAERLDFVPNLSILDLLMCEGSAAMSYLKL